MLVDNIRRRCKAQGTTFAALEREIGIGNGTIARWAVMNPRLDLIKKVADYFGCTIDDLMR